MGLFDDKKYENMDWISQAVEPIEGKVSEILGSLPDEFVFDFASYKLYTGGSERFSLDQVITKMIRDKGLRVEYREMGALARCFQFEMDEDVIVNFENQTLDGLLKIVKIKAAFEEKDMLQLMGSKGVDYIDVYANNNFSRANEIADLLGCKEDVMKSRSVRTKMSGIRYRYQTIMQQNLWNLKDIELADKVGLWIASYCQTGNLAALKNLTKLKVMTYRGNPIYSIEEET